MTWMGSNKWNASGWLWNSELLATKQQLGSSWRTSRRNGNGRFGNGNGRKRWTKKIGGGLEFSTEFPGEIERAKKEVQEETREEKTGDLGCRAGLDRCGGR